MRHVVFLMNVSAVLATGALQTHWYDRQAVATERWHSIELDDFSSHWVQFVPFLT